MTDAATTSEARPTTPRRRKRLTPFVPKLTLAQANEIRDEYAIGGVTMDQLSAAFGVSVAAISQIVRGKLRVAEWPRHGSRHNRSRLTEAGIVDIRRRAAAGETHASIATSYGVLPSTISCAVRRLTWKHVP